MFRKYERTFRIRVPQHEISSKHFHSKADTQRLLRGKVLITEKIDGANIGIGRQKKDPGFFTQKRGGLVGASEHAQFNALANWANSRIPDILRIPMRYTVYGELCYAKHHIFYDRLPDLVIVFNVWNKQDEEYLAWPDLKSFCVAYGFVHVPALYYGPAPCRADLAGFIPKVSAFSSDQPAEGIVVYNYRQQIRGKVVHPRFIKGIDEDNEDNGGHWSNANLTKQQLAKDFDLRILDRTG